MTYGSLGGHLLPGTYSIVFGLWWSFVLAVRHLRPGLKNRNKRLSFAFYFPFVSQENQPPVESLVKLVSISAALMMETRSGVNFSSDTEHTLRTLYFDMGNIQHATMYAAFILGSLVELFIHYADLLPERTDLLAGAMAYFIEGFLIYSHSHGKLPLEVHVHSLLHACIFACCLFTMLELIDNESKFWFAYGRCLFTVLQGTWLYQIGFMFYPPTARWRFWDLSERGLRDLENNVPLVAIAFSWHAVFALALLIIQFVLVKFCMRKFRIWI
jgi:hypothetical protein